MTSASDDSLRPERPLTANSTPPPQIPMPEALIAASAAAISPDLLSMSSDSLEIPTVGLAQFHSVSVSDSMPLETQVAHPDVGNREMSTLRVESPLETDSHSQAARSTSSLQEPAVQPGIRWITPSVEQTDIYKLPIPVLPASTFQSPITVADIITPGTVEIPPEIAEMVIVISPDGTYIDTQSGAAARAIKHYFDKLYGVGVSVRSPYIASGFLNQHGAKKFRVSHRDLSAPINLSAQVEARITEASQQSSYAKRRSRMSMHNFLPHAMFSRAAGISMRPQTSTGPRKLRKTRSIPDLFSFNADDTGLSGLSPQQGTELVLTGRAHSQSVTDADISRYPLNSIAPTSPLPSRDLFAITMCWPTTKVNIDDDKTGTVLPQPFGPGILFESPMRKPVNVNPMPLPVPVIPAPRLLRDVPSYESWRTARPAYSEAATADCELERPPSALRIVSLDTPSEVDVVPRVDEEVTTEPGFGPSLGAAAHTQHPIDVFDVIQTYSGLPNLDKLSPDSEGTTVKLSLSSDQTAAPRNDPRFVIWGEFQPERESDDMSTANDDRADLSPAPSSQSKRRSTKGTKVKTPELSFATSGGPRILIAATIERWIAQLTSDLDYDELLNLFLTYRSYIGAIELCQLLICRLHWALSQPSSPRDESARRIVRVRTFVAFRYWLLTFFNVDFLPNRDLRLLLSSWLNTLSRDPVLEKHKDSMGIVRRLIKVAKECKQVHTRTQPKTLKPSKPPAEHLLGKHFAEATRTVSTDDDDSDLDLDFLLEESHTLDNTNGFPSDPANVHLSNVHLGAGLSPTRPNTLPLSTLSLLQHTTNLTPGPSTNPESSFIQSPNHSVLSRAFEKTIGRLGRWKRVLNSRTVGRTSISACADVSAFDLELSVSRDLLTVNGGVEQYLKMAQRQSSVVPGQRLPLTAPLLQQQSPDSSDSRRLSVVQKTQSDLPNSNQYSSQLQTSLEPITRSRPPSISHPLPPTPNPQTTNKDFADEDLQSSPSLPPGLESRISSMNNTSQTKLLSPVIQPKEIDISISESDGYFRDSLNESTLEGSPERPSSHYSSSTDSLGVPIHNGDFSRAFPANQRHFQFDVVSIDDLEFSDTSSDIHVKASSPTAHAGLRRPPKKLPLRREFEFVQRPETLTSMGRGSRESKGSHFSAQSSSSLTGLGGTIEQWQMNALVDSLTDDDEEGDVEAALRRLEGQINPERQQEKISKVNGWVRTIQKRIEAGDYGDEEPRFFDDDDDDDHNSMASDDHHESASQYDASQHDNLAVTPTLIASGPQDQDEVADMAHTPVPTQTTHDLSSSSGPHSPIKLDAKPTPEDAVPPEILRSRVSSTVNISESISGPISGPSALSLPSRFGNPEVPQIHRSFVLGLRPEVLAEHFAMIDRELFMGVKFEELVSDDWKTCEEIDVLDWAQYLKDRARWKAESRFSEKTSALAAIRARFNLMANFVIAEIILTQPNERHIVVSKFVRIAVKSYELSNFHTCTAIIAALQSDWVNKAMKRRWNRLGMMDSRVLKQLKTFTSHLDDFQYIRNAVASIADAKPLDSSRATSAVNSGNENPTTRGRAGSDNRPPAPSACVPFIGIYLSQLQKLDRLPDLIDPTAPNEAVGGINPATSNFDPPAHPEVFSALTPLPPSMHLEPLINVHKQRKIAGVIKSLVAGQHLASRVRFDIDKRLFQRCLRLRGLDSATLNRALAMFPE